ncbi:hypothetical protein CBR_g19343 [Chara braunii]|uniref:Uncharacterized protein n=1 Tax=Chara braunii TaxID=69332 RepID=A0A388KXR4_CHABU|nr:hypothetical protein CBR_g19343 [Chara braunii]|eukprot:GBG74831.1 hypothetical protein CBR_g19343 [Chara braunii]
MSLFAATATPVACKRDCQEEEEDEGRITSTGDPASQSSGDNASRSAEAVADKWARKELMMDGADLLGKIRLPQYLLLARALLLQEEHTTTGLTAGVGGSVSEGTGAGKRRFCGPYTTSWWIARTLMMHQRVLTDSSPSLVTPMTSAMKQTLVLFGGEDQEGEARASQWWSCCCSAREKKVIRVAALVEAGLMENAYGRVDPARSWFVKAAMACGIDISITGALGFRTRHQVDPKAQMVLKTRSLAINSGGECRNSAPISDDDEDSEIETDHGQGIPEEESKNGREMGGGETSTKVQGHDKEGYGEGMYAEYGSSDVLKAPVLVEQGENGNRPAEVLSEKKGRELTQLRSIEQVVVLAKCVEVRKNSPSDELRNWQMAPYIEALESQRKTTFTVKAACSLLRSRWERERSRTRERSLMLMEELVWWELGEQMVSSGLIGSALRIFEEMELWDSLINCYRLLGKTAQGTALVTERLKVTPDDPRLWCSLGDLTHDDDAYRTAWRVSGQRYVRAQRSLARSAMKRNDFIKAIGHWETALTINPLHADGWFSFGFSAMKAGEDDKALNAFTRSVQLDPDCGEAWNNIAALNMKKKRSNGAFKALQEALKFRRESWQTWENLVQVAIDIRNYSQVPRLYDDDDGDDGDDDDDNDGDDDDDDDYDDDHDEDEDGDGDGDGDDDDDPWALPPNPPPLPAAGLGVSGG